MCRTRGMNIYIPYYDELYISAAVSIWDLRDEFGKQFTSATSIYSFSIELPLNPECFTKRITSAHRYIFDAIRYIDTHQWDSTPTKASRCVGDVKMALSTSHDPPYRNYTCIPRAWLSSLLKLALVRRDTLYYAFKTFAREINDPRETFMRVWSTLVTKITEIDAWEIYHALWTPKIMIKMITERGQWMISTNYDLVRGITWGIKCNDIVLHNEYFRVWFRGCYCNGKLPDAMCYIFWIWISQKKNRKIQIIEFVILCEWLKESLTLLEYAMARLTIRELCLKMKRYKTL